MNMQRSSALRTFHSSKWCGFLLHGRLNPLVLLSYSQSLGLWSPASEAIHLRSHLMVKVRAKKNGRLDLLALG